MEDVRIFLNDGVETNVNGIFYVFNSKYYFIYTTGELEENEYVKLYVVQVCKEVQNTPSGPIDTGYMIGMEIKDPEEWHRVQQSITKIVEDKKRNIQSQEIQYLPTNMLVNLKIVSKNKFKLVKHIVENDFNVLLSQPVISNNNNDEDFNLNNNLVDIMSNVENIETNTQPVVPIEANLETNINLNGSDLEDPVGDVIIDYRASFFEEQEKNKQLEEQIKMLNDKLENIKSIIG